MMAGISNVSGTTHDKPITTVVIPTWNSTSTLPRALASIADEGSRVEIILVDDRSDDRDAVRAIAGADSRITLIEKPERTNAAHSRAIGLERARGDVVLFLDSDDHFRPRHLSRRRQIHRETRRAIVIGRFRLNDGTHEWDGPMNAYEGGSIEDYLFSGGGEARSSTISVDKTRLRGTTFDGSLTKHQDWGFILDADRNGERIGFDPVAGVVIDLANGSRMSGRSDVATSLSFASDRILSSANRRRFLVNRLRTSLRLGDTASAIQFRKALLALEPSSRERLSSAAMIAAAQLGLAAPLHRLLASRR